MHPFAFVAVGRVSRRGQPCAPGVREQAGDEGAAVTTNPVEPSLDPDEGIPAADAGTGAPGAQAGYGVGGQTPADTDEAGTGDAGAQGREDQA